MSTTLQPKTYNHWTPPRRWQLMEMLEDGMTDYEIADHFGVTQPAIKHVRDRFGLRPTSRIHYSAIRAADLLGVSHSLVIAWIDEGLLHAERGVQRWVRQQWRISFMDLVEFLENPDNDHLWEPDVVDRMFIQQAERRAKVRFLTIDEVGVRYGRSRGAVWNWIHRGWLPAVKRGRLLVRESDLDGFVPPAERKRRNAPKREFTEQEDAVLLTMRAEGARWVDIGCCLGRRGPVIQGRWKLLQERRS